MGRPKVLKPILIGCACLVPIGLVVGLSANWNHTIFISAAGSSGARGVVNGFGQRYHQEHSEFEINAESGGTATGLKDVSESLCDIGNSTNNPYKFIYNEDGTPKFDWNSMKTFTLGWEGVALIYKMPDGLSSEAQEYFDVCINKDNINDLLAVFSAYNSPGWIEKEQASYYHFLTKTSKDYVDSHGLKDLCQNTSIIPYVRSGGDRSASSSIAFSKCSHFETNLTPEQTAAFEGGQYGNDRDYYETDESNAQAWSMFEYNDKSGQMVYMTTSFFNESNLKVIKEKGYKIAKYGEKEVSLINPDTGNFDLSKICRKDEGYNWFRPINCSINIQNENAVNFITWIYNSLSQEEYEELLAKYGIKHLDPNQIGSLGSLDPTSLETDLVLERTRKDQVFGAEELLND